ncbi:MAG TPA: NAD(+)/NADH kinase [Acidimicrobiales bacterium]|nr:NAD(+)/NADH kinase [Acidimicrobiales bacterium]
MAHIGLAPHPERAASGEAAKKTAQWLEESGHTAVILQEPGPGAGEAAETKDLDLLVSMGGDGTMLRSVGLVVGKGVPVLGVNFGAFGYLAAAEPEGLRHAIERFLSGDYHLVRRMTVDVLVIPEDRAAPRFRATGLNDVVLARPSGTHTISTSVTISSERFLSYAADSMIVSTATGSTGYNFSARGPIISPKLRCLVLTPVSPHMLFDRSIVLDSSDTVSLRVEGRSNAELIVDGVRLGELEVGEQLVCSAGASDAVLVTFGDRSFESVLKSKFRLADR